MATAIKGGDMGARVKIGSVILRDEIDDLRRIFNGMAEEIATSHAQLEQKARRLYSKLLSLLILCYWCCLVKDTLPEVKVSKTVFLDKSKLCAIR